MPIPKPRRKKARRRKPPRKKPPRSPPKPTPRPTKRAPPPPMKRAPPPPPPPPNLAAEAPVPKAALPSTNATAMTSTERRRMFLFLVVSHTPRRRAYRTRDEPRLNRGSRKRACVDWISRRGRSCCVRRSVAVRNRREERGASLLFEHQPAVAVLPSHPREERHAEQVLAERLVGQHQAGDVTHRERADIDAVELDRRRSHDAVGGRDVRRVFAARRMNAETSGIALAQGDDRGAGVDQERHAPSVDRRFHLEVAVVAARDRHAARVGLIRERVHRPGLVGRCGRARDVGVEARHQARDDEREDGEQNNVTHGRQIPWVRPAFNTQPLSNILTTGTGAPALRPMMNAGLRRSLKIEQTGDHRARASSSHSSKNRMSMRVSDVTEAIETRMAWSRLSASGLSPAA